MAYETWTLVKLSFFMSRIVDHLTTKYVALILIIMQSPALLAQVSFQGREHLFTIPHSYTVLYTTDLMMMDGKAAEPAWNQAPWSTYFTDIEGEHKPAPAYQTRFKMVWDKHHLYVYAELEEPHLWGTLTHHDDIVYNNNDFEIFIDPDGDTHQYYEIEVNVLKTILDLYMDKPYRNRGITRLNWNAAGLKTGIALQGTLNKPDDIDKQWTIEMAIPFAALTMDKPTPTPENNTVWRMNFSRVQWHHVIANNQYQRRMDDNQKLLPENNWVWSQQGVINMHFPERWGYVLFSTQAEATGLPTYKLPFSESAKHYLWLVYYKQKDFFASHKRYANSLDQLGIVSPAIHIENQSCSLSLNANDAEFNVILKCNNSLEQWQLNQHGLIRKLN